eukprot:710691-Amorphochlora_amoeboformis.AAC.1
MSDDPGMMSGAYFVGKRALLEWANEFLGTEIKKVEEFSTGWAHCQVTSFRFFFKLVFHFLDTATFHGFRPSMAFYDFPVEWNSTLLCRRVGP